METQPDKSPEPLSRRTATSFELISEYPEAGTIADDVELAGVHRVLLVDTQHYVYYRINRAAKRIEVLAVWSTKRGQPPTLFSA